MSTPEEIVNALNLVGCRVTQPRRALIRVLFEEEGFLSPQAIHKRALDYCDSLGLVTVYRTLDLLAEMGYVRRIHAQDGCHGFALAKQGHFHHLVCRKCGATLQVAGCDLSAYFEQVSRETGFQVQEHLLELSGVCANCR